MDGIRRSGLLFEASLLSAAIALGTNPVAVKYAATQIPPLPFVALRFTLAGLVLMGILRLFEPATRLRRKDLATITGVGAIGIGFNNVIFTFGVSLTSASDTALIYATPPLWGMLLGFALGVERPKARGVLGIGLALLGVGIVVYGGLSLDETSLPGDLLVAGGAVCWGSYTAYSSLLLRYYSPLAVATYTTLVAGLVVLPIASVEIWRTDWTSVGAAVWSAVAYSALFVAAFGFTSWQRGINRIGANRVLVYQYLVTLTGVVSGVVLFGESLGINKIVGGVVILLGVYLARRQ